MADVFGALAANTAQAQTAKQQVASIYDQLAGMADQMITLVAGGTVDGETPMSLEAKELGALEVQNKKARLYDSINNGAGFEAFSQQMTDKLVAAINTRTEAAKVVQQKEAVGLFDNPVQFLVNQVTLGDDYARLKGADTEVAAISQGMQQLNAQMQQTAQTNNEYAKIRTAAGVESKVNAIKSMLDAKALQAKAESLRTNAEGIERVFKFDSVGLENAMRQQQLEYQAESHAMQRESLAMQREDRVAKRLALQQQLDALEDTKQRDAFRAEAIRQAMISEGADPVAVSKYITDTNVDKLLKTPGPEGKKLQTWLELGTDMVMSGKKILGDSALEVYTMKNNLGIKPKNQVQIDLLDILDKSVAEGSTKGGKDVKVVDQLASTAYVDRLNTYRNAVDGRDESNPYRAPPLETLMNQQAIRQTPWYKVVIAPQIAAGGLKTSDPQTIIDLSVAAASSGKISFEAAMDGVLKTYITAVDLNKTANEYTKFGAPDQTLFNAKLTAPKTGVALADVALFGNSPLKRYVTVPLNDREALKRYLMQRIVAERGLRGVADIRPNAVAGVISQTQEK